MEDYATTRKVAGLIPDGVIFLSLNPFGGTVALGSTQSLTAMNTRDISWEYRRPEHRAENLTNNMCRLSRNSGSRKLLDP